MKMQDVEKFNSVAFDIRRTVADCTLSDQQKIDALMKLSHVLMGHCEDAMFRK